MQRSLLLPPLILVIALGASLSSLDRVAPFDNPLVDAFPPLAEGEGAVLFGGDMLLGDAAWGRMKKHGMDWQFRKIQPVIDSANAVAFVTNQEGPITSNKKKGKPGGVWSYRQDPRTVDVLKAAGITHVSIANNHAEDRELRGMLDSLELTRKAGIHPFGAGRNAKEAREPAIIDVLGTKVALVGGMQNWDRYRRAGWEAKEDKGGVLLFRDDELASLVKAARKRAELVVAFPHWGDNYSPINSDQRAMARKFVRAGFDAVVGHHSHDGQPWGFVQDKPVIWSLGNLVFGSPGRFGPDKYGEGYGLLCRMVIRGGVIDRFELVAMQINNRLNGYQPEPLTRAEARRVMRDFARREGSPVRFTETGVAVFDVAANRPPAPRKAAKRKKAEKPDEAGKPDGAGKRKNAAKPHKAEKPDEAGH